jgi:hypothetical protein
VATYDVVTGMLADTPFAPHGHVLRLRIELDGAG